MKNIFTIRNVLANAILVARTTSGTIQPSLYNNKMFSPSSGTDVTVGTVALRIADFSSEGADLLHRLSPDSSTMFGRTRVWPAPLLGPQVLPFTPSAGTNKILNIKSLSCYS